MPEPLPQSLDLAAWELIQMLPPATAAAEPPVLPPRPPTHEPQSDRPGDRPRIRPAPLIDPSGPMGAVVDLARRVARSDLPVLLQGETGVGKDVIAREIHASSTRAGAPFVKVHCAALPRGLLESELFGHEQGAFTGALRRKFGRFELANGGTIFLDEIAEMDPALQAKLLQVLQDSSFSRIGGNEEIHVDVHVLCASNRPLHDMIARGTFREDLFFRIQAVTIHIPPLRERRSEILPLFRRFLELHAEALGRPAPEPSSRLLACLTRHSFPGNVRELENLARRLAVLRNEDCVIDELLRCSSQVAPGRAAPLDELMHEFESTAGDVPLLEVRRRAIQQVEREVIEKTLIATRCNRRKAARLLGVSYSTLLQKIRVCGLEPLASAVSGP